VKPDSQRSADNWTGSQIRHTRCRRDVRDRLRHRECARLPRLVEFFLRERDNAHSRRKMTDGFAFERFNPADERRLHASIATSAFWSGHGA